MRVGPTLDKLLEEYPDDVAVYYKQHPLPMHSHAMLAAEAALAANAQGKFTEMHERLLQSSRSLSRETILQIAQEIGLDIERFTHDLDTQAYKDVIAKQTQEAVSVGATGTPASFVNGHFISGAQPYEKFKQLVDQELARQKAP